MQTRVGRAAELAFGKNYTVVDQLMYSATMRPEEKPPDLRATRRIVAPAPNPADLIGYFPAPEGTVVISRPRPGADPDYLASVPPTRRLHL